MFDIHEAEQVMTIAYYNGGVRVVDLSGLEGISLGGVQVAGAGMKEIACFRFPDGDTWAAKTPRIDPLGRLLPVRQRRRPRARRLPLRRVRAPSTQPGRWLTPAEARSVLPRASTAGYQLFCLTAP